MRQAALLRLSSPVVAGMLVVVSVLVSMSTAMAAVPPLKMASERQASLRKEAAGQKIDVLVTVTAGELKSYTKSGVSIGSAASFEFSADAPAAWKILSALVSANDPLGALQTHIGKIDVSQTKIETLDDGFVYVWGNSPAVAISHDFSRIRRLTVRSNNHSWEFRLSGDLGLAGLPERIHVLRSGEPYASVEIEQATLQ
jgi:hypothetical protein